jgi:D-alanine-D-alanine ligase
MTRDEMLTKRIGVIYGGVNTERDVSLETGSVIHKALLAKGYKAVLIDYTGSNLPQRLIDEKIEVAYIALHGTYGEDGALQGMLEIMGIPYIGTKGYGSTIGMDKFTSKILFREAGLPVAPAVLVRAGEAIPELPFGYPVVVKPNSDGSSFGVSIVRDPEDLDKAVADALAIEPRILIEAFVKGREISVSVLNGKALGAIWIKPAREFYDYVAKYLTNDTEYIYPVPLSEHVYQRCLEIGEATCKIVRGEGVLRCDLIVTDNDEMVILEVNTLPGMTSHSLVPQTAKGEGIAFEDLIEQVLLSASLGLRPARRS